MSRQRIAEAIAKPEAARPEAKQGARPKHLLKIYKYYIYFKHALV